LKELMDSLLSMKPRSNTAKVMDCLIKAKEPLKPKDIRDALGLEMRRVTTTLSILRRKGLAEKVGEGYVSTITYLDIILYLASSFKRIEKLKGE